MSGLLCSTVPLIRQSGSVVINVQMASSEQWMEAARDALRSHVGAVAYVIIEETLDALGLQGSEVSMRNLPLFLRKLRELLPEGVDRDEVYYEVGRVLMNCLPRHEIDSAKGTP